MSKDQEGSLLIPIAVGVLLLLVVGAVFLKPFDDHSSNFINEIRQKSGSSESVTVTFTQPIFDPEMVSNITPLGELMGGYEEATALAGVMINLKPEAYAGGKDIEVKAPTDMKLESYAHFIDPNDGGKNWALIFQISPQIKIRFDHITRVPQKVIDATTTTPKNNSAEEYPKNKISFKAGEVIAYTSGTKMAHNWNIYLTDTRNKNNFINSERYQTDMGGQRLLTARCPFDFYPDEMKNKFMKLMGYNKPGQSQSCGNPSKDVAGTLSGMWHLSSDPKTGTSEQIDGVYASPLSVFKNSAGEVTIDQVNNQRLDIPPNNKTNQNPKEITGEHCYQLTSGYAYFKVISSTQMQFAYSSSGICPTTFPTAQAKTYYR